MKEIIQALLFNPINLTILFSSLIVYLVLLTGNFRAKHLFNSAAVKDSILCLTITCLFPIKVAGISISFLDRWSRYGGTFVSILTNLVFTLIFLFLLERIGFLKLQPFLVFLIKEPLILILSIIIVSSFLWSETPDATFQASIGYLLTIFVATQFAYKCSWEELERIIRIGLTFVAILTLLIAVGAPSLTDSVELWGGFIGGRKNHGILSALLANLWLLNGITSKSFDLKSLLFSCFFLIFNFLGTSITGVISLLTALYALFVSSLSQFIKRREALLLATVLGGIFIVAIVIFVGSFSDVATALGKDPTFTGRTLIWDVLFDKIHKHNALLGYGYDGFWQIWRGSDNPGANIKPSSLGDYVAPHAHNGFIEVIIQLGYLGFAVFFALFVRVIWIAIKKVYSAKGRKEKSFPLIFVMFVIFSSTGETPQLGLIGPNFAWFITVILLAMPHFQKRNELYKSSRFRLSG
jgi:exopolysaccharide production protein ExoQ